MTAIDTLFGKGAAVIWLDDNIGTHRKTLQVGGEAAWLWAASLGYARRHLTNGFIPREAVPGLSRFETPVTELVSRLVAAKFWHVAKGGYRVHDYLRYNDSRQQVLDLRRKAAARKAAWRDRQRPADVPQGQGRDNGPGPAGTDASVPRTSRARVSTTTTTTSTYTGRRIAHDQAVVAEKRWRTTCRKRGHTPICETPSACKLREASR